MGMMKDLISDEWDQAYERGYAVGRAAAATAVARSMLAAGYEPGVVSVITIEARGGPCEK